jgi:putative chitinase
VPRVNDYFDADRGGKIHGGIDFNYHYENGDKLGQTGLNRDKPTVHAPVSGEVTYTDPKKWGTVEITDADGYKHRVLHMELPEEGSPGYLARGDQVTAGDPVGKMGNQGTKDYHVHYEIKYPNKPLGKGGVPVDIPVDPNQFYDAPNYEPGPYNSSPADPG